jgi:glycosyl transferase family 87
MLARIGATCLVAIAAISIAVLFAHKVANKMPDLTVYWTAANRARHAEPLYRVADGHYQFKYLPAFAILAIPLGAVTLETAKVIWFAASVALLVPLIVLSLWILPERRKSAWVLVMLTFLVMAKFYAHELVLGQMNVLFAVLVTAAALAATRGREAATGALTALAVVVKPYAAILLPWLGARRRAVSLSIAVLGCAFVFLLPSVVYGIHGSAQLHRDWWSTVTTSTAPNLTNADNVSIAAMWTKWIGAGRISALLTGVTSALLLIVAALVFARRKEVRNPEALECALLLTLTPLLSPQGWDYVFLLSTPAVMLLLNYDDQLPRVTRIATRVALGTVALSLYDVMGRSAYGIFMSLSVITVCYFVIVAALYTLRHRALA